MWQLCGIRKTAPTARAEPCSNPNELNNLFTSIVGKFIATNLAHHPGCLSSYLDGQRSPFTDFSANPNRSNPCSGLGEKECERDFHQWSFVSGYCCS